MRSALIACGLGLVISSVLGAVPHVFSSQGNASNTIDEMHVCDGGIVLSDHATQATCNSLFPVSGDIVLNGGTLHLGRDMQCASSARWQTHGNVVGNGHTLRLPCSSNGYHFPHAASGVNIQSHERGKAGARMGAIALQHAQSDGESFLAAASYDNAKAHLVLFHVVQGRHTSCAKVGLEGGARMLAWQPHALEGVVGCAQGQTSTLHTFSYDALKRSLTTKPLGSHTGVVDAAAWSSDGKLLCVATRDEAHQLYLYRKTEKGLVCTSRIALQSQQLAPVHAIAWSPDDTSIVLGMGYVRGYPQVLLYRHHEHELVFVDGKIIAGHVSSVTFRPGVSDTFFIGVAGVTGDYRGRLYSITDTGLTAQGKLELSGDVYDMAWHPAHHILSVALCNDDGGGEIAFYKWDEDHLARVDLHVSSDRYYRLAWDPESELLAALDSSGVMHTFCLDGRLVLDTIAIVAASPLQLNASLACKGAVLIEAGGHAVYGGNGAGIHIEKDSILLLRGAHVRTDELFSFYGPCTAHLVCEDCSFDTGTLKSSVPLVVRETCQIGGEVHSDITLSKGSRLVLARDTVMRGIIFVEGDATIHSLQGTLDVSKAHLRVAPGATLTYNGVTMRGWGALQKQITLQGEESGLLFSSCNIELRDDITLMRGHIALRDRTTVHYQDQSQVLDDAAYHARKHGSLWAAIEDQFVVSNAQAGQQAPASGAIIVDAPRYQLRRDVRLTEKTPLHITKDTVIRGNGHALRFVRSNQPLITCDPGVSVRFENCMIQDFVPANIGLQTGASVCWGDGCLLSLRGGGTLDDVWKVQGRVRMDARDAVVAFAPTGGIAVDAGSSLALRRVTLTGVQGAQLACLHDTAHIDLGGVRILLSGDMMMANGVWTLSRNSRISGSFVVRYTSQQQSSIAQDVSLQLDDGCEFVYQPANRKDDRFVCLGDRATFLVRGASLATADAPWRWLAGRIVCEGDVTLRGEGSGIYLGDEASEKWVNVVPRTGSFLHLRGTVVIANMSDDN